LHNDYLGSPRYITDGDKSTPKIKGRIIGEQAFGPYGERMDGNFVVGGTPLNPILKDLPQGYKPITGYTGHVAEDMTGLIYMRGRYYSPAWHRFVNSDHGVDPLSVNQFAYVGGMPFMARDPYGMETCVIFLTIFLENNWDGRGWIITGVRIDDIVCRGDGEEGKGKDYNDPDCIALRASGMTKEQFAEMKILWDSHDPFIGTEAGSLWVDPRSNPRGSPIVPMTPTWTPEKGEPALGRPPNSPNYTVLAYLHIHPEFYFPYGDLGNSRMRNELGTSSARDREVATEKKVPSYIGDVSSLFVYRPGASNDVRIMGGGWWEKDCF
jgi:RHS repeat-associated protein